MNYDSTEDTLKHAKMVREYGIRLSDDLMRRLLIHDKSKMGSPEKEIFDEFTPKLKDSTYGSDEYKEYLKSMGEALSHHYANNQHHPEHYTNGIKGMSLVDLCEMIADWKAASLRHGNGDIMKSIEINQERFGYSDELKQILINTVRDYFCF